MAQSPPFLIGSDRSGDACQRAAIYTQTEVVTIAPLDQRCLEPISAAKWAVAQVAAVHASTERVSSELDGPIDLAACPPRPSAQLATQGCWAICSIGNGMTVELEADSSMAKWRAQVRPTRHGGMEHASIVSLTSDKAGRMADTLTNNLRGVDTQFTFDARLVNALTEQRN